MQLNAENIKTLAFNAVVCFNPTKYNTFEDALKDEGVTATQSSIDAMETATGIYDAKELEYMINKNLGFDAVRMGVILEGAFVPLDELLPQS